jgi:hypothetical protein
MGTVELASYQIVMGWIAIPFVISLGISEAAMVRVAYFVGARDPAAARQAGNLGMVVGVGVPLLLVVVPLLAPGLISRIFLDPSDPDYAKIGSLVAGLLLIAAVFQVFDGLQAIASHALRGLKDAVVPLVIAGVGYWLIGLGSGYVFGFHFGWGALGLWGGVAIGLAFTGAGEHCSPSKRWVPSQVDIALVCIIDKEQKLSAGVSNRWPTSGGDGSAKVCSRSTHIIRSEKTVAEYRANLGIDCIELRCIKGDHLCCVNWCWKVLVFEFQVDDDGQVPGVCIGPGLQLVHASNQCGAGRDEVDVLDVYDLHARLAHACGALD